MGVLRGVEFGTTLGVGVEVGSGFVIDVPSVGLLAGGGSVVIGEAPTVGSSVVELDGSGSPVAVIVFSEPPPQLAIRKTRPANTRTRGNRSGIKDFMERSLWIRNQVL